MANDNGGAYGQQGDGEQHEIVPWEYGTVDTPVPQTQLPVGPELPKQQKPPMLVQRRTMSVMMGLIVVLLLVVGGLAFAVLGSSKSSAAAPSAVGITSPPAVASTDALPSPSPSLDVSVSPSDTLATDTSTADPTDTSSPSAGFSAPLGSQPLGSPVDGEVDTGNDEHISNVDYPDSIRFYCPTSGLLDWNVAGFTTFTAVFGIPDDAQSATAIINTMTFSDQNGHQLAMAKTALGQPAQIQFALKGATRLIMSCDRQGSNDSVNNFVTLGNPLLSS